MTRALVDYYLLDCLSYDIEDLGGIAEIMNSDSELGWKSHYGRIITRSEILEALVRCIKTGLVEACVPARGGLDIVGCGRSVVPPVPFELLWFRLTSEGQLVIDNWEP